MNNRQNINSSSCPLIFIKIAAFSFYFSESSLDEFKFSWRLSKIFPYCEQIVIDILALSRRVCC